MINLYDLKLLLLLITIAANAKARRPVSSGGGFYNGTQEGKGGFEGRLRLEGYKPGDTAEKGILESVAIVEINKKYACSGTLIWPIHVLTAATCVTKEVKDSKVIISKDTVKVSLGLVARSRDNERYPVELISVHEEFFQRYESRVSHLRGNLAVLRIKGDIPYGIHIIPMNTPKDCKTDSAGHFLEQMECTFPGVDGSPDLFSGTVTVDLSLTSKDLCQKQLEEANIPESVSNFHMCTYADGKGPCPEDVGGGLICGGKVEHEMLNMEVWGVASHELNCGRMGKVPSVFTNVLWYANFIQKVLPLRDIKYVSSISNGESGVNGDEFDSSASSSCFSTSASSIRVITLAVFTLSIKS